MTLAGAVRAIGKAHRHWLRRKARKLEKVSARLACFAYLLAEGSEKWEQRARHQIGCERRYRQSSEESLRALRFLSAAESRRRLGRLAALNERLRARPLVLTKAQARLDATFGRLCAAWQWRVRQRALRERRKVLAAECEVMLGRISLERFENCSQIEALRYLQAARDYWRAAQARCQSRWPPKPLARPDDWGLAMPPMGQLERMIAERAQASNARS